MIQFRTQLCPPRNHNILRGITTFIPARNSTPILVITGRHRPVINRRAMSVFDVHGLLITGEAHSRPQRPRRLRGHPLP